jgi:hypothetical protein
MWSCRDAETLQATFQSWQQRAAELAPDYAELVQAVNQLEKDRVDVKWRVRWFPRQLKWLDEFGKAVPGWKVEYYDVLERYAVLSEFRWRALFKLFATAIRTGTLRLPESAIEGRWTIRVLDGSGQVESVQESVWLVDCFRKFQVKNRRVARDMLLWQEIRQPANFMFGQWDELFSSQLHIDDVPGMGQFDIDGLTDSDRSSGYTSAFLIIGFCTVMILSFGIAYGVIHMQTTGRLDMYDNYSMLYDLVQ